MISIYRLSIFISFLKKLQIASNKISISDQNSYRDFLIDIYIYIYIIVINLINVSNWE